ncbi:MAG: 3'(2'),5'-bisphosphate nucleotidase CysQ [Caulobacteraceae bacterium]|nr:3'(2'),5'-bisphosphate nucleotidase CysQ [Caulobacteraceae bacterium]
MNSEQSPTSRDGTPDWGPVFADIVEAASAIILSLWRTGLTVESKRDQSPVTEADRRGEALILERLAMVMGEVPVVAEEASAAAGAPPRSIARRFLLVDPLDGTKAFVNGEAHFTVNIALIEDGAPTSAAVAAPALGETWFTAAQGARKRAFGEAEGRPIRVRAPQAGRVLALTSHALKDEQYAEYQARYGVTERQPMNSSLKLCILAEGGADLYPRHGPTMEWDIAAGHAVLTAAGGRLTTPEGEPFRYGKADQGFVNGWFVARGG